MPAPPFHSLAPGARAPDGLWWIGGGPRLRAAVWHADAPRGHVILLTGRTEFLEKAAIPAAAFVRRGLSVVSLDWRGQGLSDRLADPREKGHVGDFSEFQDDLDRFLASPEVAGLIGPRLLVGHSMGGAIGRAAMARPAVATTVSAAILSAPMLGIALNPAMRMVAWATIKIGLALGKTEAWPPFGDSATTYVLAEKNPETNVLTADDAVWDWMVETAQKHPDLSLGMPTLGWFAASAREMARLKRLPPAPCPTLCLLGSDEAVVDARAVRSGARKMGAAFRELPGGRHELLIEAHPIRAQAWTEIDAFLAQNGFGPGSA